MNQNLTDKDIMEGILNTTKGACDLYLHGTIESSTSNVNQAFDGVLNETLKMQNDIYTKMSSKGWYPSQQAEQQQIQQVKTKYANM